MAAHVQVRDKVYFSFHASVSLVDAKVNGHFRHNPYDTCKLAKLGIKCISEGDRPTLDTIVESIHSLFLLSINVRGVLPLKGCCLRELIFQDLSTITDNFSVENFIGNTL